LLVWMTQDQARLVNASNAWGLHALLPQLRCDSANLPGYEPIGMAR
jgi:hypothetical protein